MSEGKNVSIKALVLGVLTHIGVIIALGIISSIIFTAIMFSREPSLKELAAVLENVLPFYLFIGWGNMLFAGFVTGAAAKKGEVLHAMIVGGIVVIYTNLLFISELFSQEWSPASDWHWLRSIGVDAGIVLCAALGGYLAQRRRLKKLDARQRDGAYRGERIL